MPDYQNAKIYKLVSPHTDKIYIGSTVQKYLCQRLAVHKHSKKYSSKKLFELGDVEIILIEKYPCDSRLELEKRERYHIETNNCVNETIPSRTNKESQKQWCQKNKDYYLKNKEKIRQSQKEYYLKNKNKI